MPVITRDVTVLHRLQKSGETTEVTLAAGTQVSLIKEWTTRLLIRTPDGKVFNVLKQLVDTSR